MKKIRFIENTKIRKKQEINQSAVLGRMRKGKIIDVIGEAVPGIEYSDEVSDKTITTNLWYQCKNGWYYWAGGTVDGKDSKFNQFKEWEIHTQYNFRDRLKISDDKRAIVDEWTETGGAGIKIGIIDSGLDLNHNNLIYYLKENNDKFYNFTSTGGPRQVSGLKRSHGTICTLLIAGRPYGNNKFIGAAPFAELFYFKVVEDNTGIPETKNIINAISKAVSLNLDIITISAGQPASKANPILKTKLDEILEKANQKQVIVVVAARENNNTELSLLAQNPNTIAVDVSYGQPSLINHPSQIDFVLHSIAKKMNFPKSPRQSWLVDFSSSYATPLITSTLANYASFQRSQHHRIDLEEARETLSDVFFGKSKFERELKQLKPVNQHSIFMINNKA